MRFATKIICIFVLLVFNTTNAKNNILINQFSACGNSYLFGNEYKYPTGGVLYNNMTKLIDLTGYRFGKLTVLKRVPNKGNCTAWECICDCGNIKIVTQSSLHSKKTKSCGCYRINSIIERSFKHGEINTKEYKAWKHAKDRCFNSNTKNYYRYGGRGITVCERWKNSFENFLSDMGYAPSINHSIDRIDNNGNYEQNNCRWATWKQQHGNRSNNRWIEFNGEKRILADWARKLNIDCKKVDTFIKNNSASTTT